VQRGLAVLSAFLVVSSQRGGATRGPLTGKGLDPQPPASRELAMAFARGGCLQVRFHANGYSFFARRSGEPLARLRLTGNGDESCCSIPHTVVAGGRSATSGRAP